jgi:hypothetical protein
MEKSDKEILSSFVLWQLSKGIIKNDKIQEVQKEINKLSYSRKSRTKELK